MYADQSKLVELIYVSNSSIALVVSSDCPIKLNNSDCNSLSCGFVGSVLDSSFILSINCLIFSCVSEEKPVTCSLIFSISVPADSNALEALPSEKVEYISVW